MHHGVLPLFFLFFFFAFLLCLQWLTHLSTYNLAWIYELRFTIMVDTAVGERESRRDTTSLDRRKRLTWTASLDEVWEALQYLRAKAAGNAGYPGQERCRRLKEINKLFWIRSVASVTSTAVIGRCLIMVLGTVYL